MKAAETRVANGLTQAGAQARLAQYGYNELPEKHVNPLLKLT